MISGPADRSSYLKARTALTVYRPAMTVESVDTQVGDHLKQGFRAIKVRLAGDDLDEIVLKAAADALGGAGEIMADLNEKGSLTVALRTLGRVAHMAACSSKSRCRRTIFQAIGNLRKATPAG